MTIEEARRNIGNAVVYRPCPGASAEQGIITSVNNAWVFVRYGANSTSMATDPAELALIGDRR